MLAVLDRVVAALQRYHPLDDARAEKAPRLFQTLHLRKGEAPLSVVADDERQFPEVQQLAARDDRKLSLRL